MDHVIRQTVVNRHELYPAHSNVCYTQFYLLHFIANIAVKIIETNEMCPAQGIEVDLSQSSSLPTVSVVSALPPPAMGGGIIDATLSIIVPPPGEQNDNNYYGSAI